MTPEFWLFFAFVGVPGVIITLIVLILFIQGDKRDHNGPPDNDFWIDPEDW